VESVEGSEDRIHSFDQIVTRYVRREIRSMSENDREKVLDAMEIMYSIEQIEGEKKYGSKFKNAGFFSALHSTTDFCYHGGDMFLTTHPTLQLWFEQSLRAIDPSISTSFYWDFMLDDKLYGSNWYKESKIYDENWFGAVQRTEKNDFRVDSGRFAFTKVPRHKPDRNATDRYEVAFKKATYNSYGFLGQWCDNSISETIQRSVSFCGIETKQQLSSLETLRSCFGEHDVRFKRERERE
jgi:hypothetical protein